MKTIFKISFCLLLLLCFGCERKAEPVISNSVTATEYEIYSVVIDSLFGDNDSSMIVIPDSTDIYQSPITGGYKKGKYIEFNDLNRLGHMDSIWFISDHKELSKNYKLKNKKRYSVDGSKLSCSINIKQLSTDSLKTIFKSVHKGWDKFYELFPNAFGTATFSRIGFNKDNNQAVFYVTEHHYYLNAEGKYVLLYKMKGKWQIKTIARVWVS